MEHNITLCNHFLTGGMLLKTFLQQQKIVKKYVKCTGMDPGASQSKERKTNNKVNHLFIVRVKMFSEEEQIYTLQ